MMSSNVVVNGASPQIGKIYVVIDGIHREISKGYAVINREAREIFSGLYPELYIGGGIGAGSTVTEVITENTTGAPYTQLSRRRTVPSYTSTGYNSFFIGVILRNVPAGPISIDAAIEGPSYSSGDDDPNPQGYWGHGVVHPSAFSSIGSTGSIARTVYNYNMASSGDYAFVVEFSEYNHQYTSANTGSVYLRIYSITVGGQTFLPPILG